MSEKRTASSSTTGANQQTDGGSGTGGANTQNNNANFNRNNPNNQRWNVNRGQTPGFKDNTRATNGHVFEVGNMQSAQYTHTSGKGRLNFKDLKLDFGAYYLVAEEGDSSMRGKMFGAIALVLIGYNDGGYEFMAL